MALMEKANPSLSTALHRDVATKPFTLSVPQQAVGLGRSAWLKEGENYSVRITLLDETLFTNLADAVYRLNLDNTLALGEIRVACNGLVTVPAPGNRAAFSSFERLADGAGTDPVVRLAFLSPCTFRSRGARGQRNVIFPEPSLVFSSLLSRWNAFAPESLRLALPDGAMPRISTYRLSTRPLGFGSYSETGFCGQATYECLTASEEERRKLNLLADFAFFAGVGAKTTMGMGQCKRLALTRSHVPDRG